MSSRKTHWLNPAVLLDAADAPIHAVLLGVILQTFADLESPRKMSVFRDAEEFINSDGFSELLHAFEFDSALWRSRAERIAEHTLDTRPPSFWRLSPNYDENCSVESRNRKCARPAERE